MLNESNLSQNINYAINRFLNICVNHFVSRKSTFVIIVITFVFVSNLAFLEKIQSNAQSKIKNVIIIIAKCVSSATKNFTRRASVASNSISSEIAINATRKKTIETTNVNKKTTTITTTTKNIIRTLMIRMTSTRFT